MGIEHGRIIPIRVRAPIVIDRNFHAERIDRGSQVARQLRTELTCACAVLPLMAARTKALITAIGQKKRPGGVPEEKHCKLPRSPAPEPMAPARQFPSNHPPRMIRRPNPY